MKLKRIDESPRERNRRRRVAVAASFRRPPKPATSADEEGPPPSLRWTEPGGEAPTLGVGGAMVPPQIGGNSPVLDILTDVPLEGDIGDRIRALEARLDGLLHHTKPANPAPQPTKLAPPTTATPAPDANAPSAPSFDESPSDPVRRSPFYRRMWGTAGHRGRAEHVDEFGWDPDYENRYAKPLLDLLYRSYFRVQTSGMEHVPAEGRCMIVANHSGTVPLDGPMLRTALRREHPGHRELRWLAEDFLYYLPFVGTHITRVGAVRACAENAERLLRQEHCVAVFPEGVRGISKTFHERYQLQRFGRGGFVRLALRTGTPIVPCAVIGAEETAPMLYREELVSKWLGLPYLPITPTFPWLGPVGLIPAPTRWSIVFGEPLNFAEYGPGASDDDVLVGRLSDHVHAQVQRMVDDGVRTRRSVWFG